MNYITLSQSFSGAAVGQPGGAVPLSGPSLLVQTTPGCTATVYGSNLPKIEATWQVIGTASGYAGTALTSKFAFIRVSLSAAGSVAISATQNSTSSSTPGSGPVTSDDITDASAIGKQLLRAADAAAARAALDVPTTGALAAKYTKPAGGIPAADLEADSAGRVLLTATSAAERKQVLGLDQVNNTSDANKPISTAAQTALDGKMANTLPAMQTAFDAGTAPQKAAFQSSVSGAGIEYAGSRKSLPLRALLAASAAGVQPSGPLLVVGDSTSWGLYTGGGPLGSWPQVLANMLTASGRPAVSAGYSPQSSSAGGVVDSRITPGAGWSKSIYGFGAVCEQSGAATTPLTYTVAGWADRIKVYFLRNDGLGTCAVAVNGTGAGSVATSGAAGVGTQTVSFTRTQSPSITLTPASNAFILYAEIYDSTAKALRICNAGVAGSRASQWSDAGTWGALASISAMAPAHTIILLGRNDAAAGRTAAQYLSDVTAIAARASLTGGVTLVSAIGGNVAASEALLSQYLQQLRTLTQYPLIVADEILGGYAAANSAGLMFDAIHENGPGHGVLAGGIFGSLLSL